MRKIIANGSNNLFSDVYFTNAETAKIRPVLLLKINSFNDFLFMPLTSNTSVKGISIDNSHLADGNLPKTSVLIYEKPGVIAKSLLLKKIGILKEDVYRKVIEEFIQFIQK